jgi:2-polyprenyl-6-methoxyphenol hydroxylase-like FAD-dependent oxidoreductase
MDEVLIIGAGIGGLTLAHALGRAGIAVQVYERAPTLPAGGAGLTLWANAMRVFDRLGLAAAITAHGRPGMGGTIRTAQGQVLQRLTAADLERLAGGANVGIPRAALATILAAALPPGTVQLGQVCTGFQQTPAGVIATFAGGHTATGRVLVGADGLRSGVRAALWGDTPPRYAGYTAWRGIAPAPRAAADQAGELWGCGQRFGWIPVTATTVYWFATANAPAGHLIPPAARQADLLRRFGTWAAPIPELIAATESAAILQHDIVDRPPRAPWSQGAVTLLGDAAHPMTPNLGQGACQAVEDAWVLAACLRASRDPAAALRRYDAVRGPRTRRLVQQARLAGWVGQWAQPWACAVRNTLYRHGGARLVRRQLRTIAGYPL